MVNLNYKYASKTKDYQHTRALHLPEYTPIWCVYGSPSYPQVIVCMIANGAIWGYSVYKNSPGFRTLGKDVNKWVEENEALFFLEQDKALDYLKDITTPKKSALDKLAPKRFEIEDRKRRVQEYGDYF